ncbi:MAG: hypothetical protein VKN83_04250 [Cyanobacteriota bacterium]|nr:hypothetical protein [Cyanobacteriota bacterium]
MTHELSCHPERMSYFSLLARIAAGGYEAFWTEREGFRCANGNQPWRGLWRRRWAKPGSISAPQ